MSVLGWGRGTWNSGAWNSSLPVTGVSAATAVGSVRVDVQTSVTGVSAATAVGSVTITTAVLATGVQASTAVGNAFVWGIIVPGQTPEWTDIAA